MLSVKKADSQRQVIQINIKSLIKIKCQESMEFYISTTKRDPTKPSFKINRDIRKF